MKTIMFTIAFAIGLSLCAKNKTEYRTNLLVCNEQEALIAFLYILNSEYNLTAFDVQLEQGKVVSDFFEYDRGVNGIRTRFTCLVNNGELGIQFTEFSKIEVTTNTWVKAKERETERKIRESMYEKIDSLLSSQSIQKVVSEYRYMEEVFRMANIEYSNLEKRNNEVVSFVVPEGVTHLILDHNPDRITISLKCSDKSSLFSGTIELSKDNLNENQE